jgi:hypothetical protein
MGTNGRLDWLSPRLAACVFMAAAGAVHFAIVVEHSEHAPAHGLFFALLGTLQLGWAAAFWLLPTRLVRGFGFVLSGGMILLWALTRLVAAPFQGFPEPLDAAGLASAGFEAAAMAALLLNRSPNRSERLSPLAVSAAGVSVISCLLLYGGGLVAAAWIPSLASSSPLALGADEAYAELSGLSPAHAETSHAATQIRLNNVVAGGYLVRAVTSPGAGRPEDLLMEVRLLDPATRKTVTDAVVRIRASQETTGTVAESEAVQGEASIPRDYGAQLELPTSGKWHITVSIDGPLGPAEAAFDLQVSGGSGIGGQISAYLPFAGLFLLVAAYFLVGRVRTVSGTPPAG